MSNVFTKMKEFVEKPNRNTFDLSFQNNLTMEFGKLYPVFCKEVIPGDSFRIKPTFGLRFMPLVFPIQTRMQANLHFFYVRNRNLWKDWPDFIGRTKSNLVKPFLSPSVAKKVCKTRGLGDYFGIPTTLAGEYGTNQIEVTQDLYRYQILSGMPAPGVLLPYMTYTAGADGAHWYNGFQTFNQICASTDAAYTGESTYSPSSWPQGCGLFSRPLKGVMRPKFSLTYHSHLADREITTSGGSTIACTGGDLATMSYQDAYAVSWQAAEWSRLFFGLYLKDGDDWKMAGTWYLEHLFAGQEANTEKTYQVDLDNCSHQYHTDLYHFMDGARNFSEVMQRVSEQGLEYRVALYEYSPDVYVNAGVYYSCTHFARQAAVAPTHDDGTQQFSTPGSITRVILPIENEGARDLSDIDDRFNPYANGDIHIDALPFRAYESIYNAFYRNQFNDPFVLNGQKEFNKFITNDEGGEDSTDYDLMFRNYEQDFLTSAKQSPVDGDITPLVGVSGTGVFTFQNADGTQVNITPKYDTDGTTIIGLETVEGTPENTSSIRRLMDMASVGISINDFRNVNALQRWLEKNLRRGYRYRDQMMSHFGVEPKFDVLDMPEFIGGMSEPVMVNQINQSVDQTESTSGLGDFSKVLGSYAGQASVLAQSKHDIEKYCDEHGFIIGILSICPVPNYSQLLPKHFLKSSVLDYYFPEFGHIGNQPIPYSEVCPLQSYASAVSGGDERLTDVFGYQRAWYDYLASVDEVHGDFRTTLEGFLINRLFDVRPELGKDFLEVNPDTMSNPFSVTDKTDKILGQVYFDVVAQRPIPKYGIPRLE